MNNTRGGSRIYRRGYGWGTFGEEYPKICPTSQIAEASILDTPHTVAGSFER
jgi:hypothetical protein